MTSIIGYTRAPFNSICSIKPVQRINQNNTEELKKVTENQFHKIFSRDNTKSNGIIEIINHHRKSSKTNEITYNTYLSIDMSNNEFKLLKSSNNQNLIDLISILSNLAYLQSIKFNQIIHLLKKLQSFETKYHFMACIDNEKESIFIYFPNNLSLHVDQTIHWLKSELGIDINLYSNWFLYQQNEEFDGEKYFHDLHHFIHQVDLLIESNNLFSHQKNQ